MFDKWRVRWGCFTSLKNIIIKKLRNFAFQGCCNVDQKVWFKTLSSFRIAFLSFRGMQSGVHSYHDFENMIDFSFEIKKKEILVSNLMLRSCCMQGKKLVEHLSCFENEESNGNRTLEIEN